MQRLGVATALVVSLASALPSCLGAVNVNPVCLLSLTHDAGASNSSGSSCTPPWKVLHSPLHTFGTSGDELSPQALASAASGWLDQVAPDLPKLLDGVAANPTQQLQLRMHVVGTGVDTGSRGGSRGSSSLSGTSTNPRGRELLQMTGSTNAWPKGCGAGDVNPMLSPTRVVGGHFGWSLAQSTHAVYVSVGQPEDVDGINGAGKAFAFQTVRQGAGCAFKGVQLDRPFDLGLNFGLMTAMSNNGNWMLVAARLDVNWGSVFPVYAYKRTSVFSPVTGNGATKWVLTQRLPVVKPAAAASQTTYPGSIALSSDGVFALVSWYTDPGSPGSAQVFRRGSGTNSTGARSGNTNPDKFVLFQHIRPPTPVGSEPSDFGGVAAMSANAMYILVSDSSNIYAYKPGAGAYGNKFMLFDTITGDDVSVKLNPNLGDLANLGSSLQIVNDGSHFAAIAQMGDPFEPVNVVLLFQLRGKSTFYDMKCVVTSPIGNFYGDKQSLSLVQTNSYFLKLGVGVQPWNSLTYSTAFVYRFSTEINTAGLKKCTPMPELQFINPLANSANSQFGRAISVALDGRVTLVGAPYQSVNTRAEVGAVFIYDTYNYMDDPTWHGQVVALPVSSPSTDLIVDATVPLPTG